MARLVTACPSRFGVRGLDFDAIRQMDRKIFGEDLDERLDNPKSRWWIVEDPLGQMVGYAGARFLTKENAVFLCRAGVDPKARGRGLQRRLIRARVNWARRIGAKAVITYTMAHNHPSSNNLIRCSFELYDPAHAWVGRSGVLYWRRDL